MSRITIDHWVVEQALEALEMRCGTNAEERGPDGVITALKQALSEPEQEPQTTHWEGCEAVHPECRKPEQKPVGRVTGWHGGHCVIELLNPALVLPDNTALYAAPTPRKPLTDEQIEALWQNTSPYYDHQDFARAIERKHGIGEQV